MKQKKHSIVSTIIFFLFLGITIVAIIFSKQIFDEAESIFNKSISDNTHIQSLYMKIPTIIRSIEIVTLAFIVSLVCRWGVKKSLTKTKRGKTIATLLNSLIKWIIAIATILLVLGAFGVQTGTLLASAGILSLVIGLGAQSLIADIIAGLFIVIEGEYQVGDIVIIDDWRGTVLEIGIRTTKIIDAGGNIKIINNSEIKSVINQTKELSLAKATIGIEYGESLPKVEEVILKNLNQIHDHIPAIVEGPFYKGVTALGQSSVDLLVTAKCKEEDIYQVQRDLNKELKLLFDENHINIPFPQIVLNQPTVIENKKTTNTKNIQTNIKQNVK